MKLRSSVHRTALLRIVKRNGAAGTLAKDAAAELGIDTDDAHKGLWALWLGQEIWRTSDGRLYTFTPKGVPLAREDDP